MFLSLLILLLLSNALTLKRDKSILFSRVVIIGLISTSYLALNNLFLKSLEKGIGIYGGLFNVTTFTQTFNIFIFIISAIILTLTVFYPRKVYIKEHSFLYDLLFFKFSNFFILVPSAVTFSLKLPLVVGMKLLDLELYIPVLSGFSACLVYIIQRLIADKNLDINLKLLWVFILIISDYSYIYLLPCIHSYLLKILGLTGISISIPSLFLYAESSRGGSSGYGGDI